MKEQVEQTIEWFSEQVKEKLFFEIEEKNKKDWRPYSLKWLFKRLLDEVAELGEEVLTDHTLCPPTIIRECADVASLAMFIADKAQLLQNYRDSLKPKKDV